MLNNSMKYRCLTLLWVVAIVIIIICLTYAFKNSISLYRTPDKLVLKDYESSENFRIGGYVTAPLVTYNNAKCISFFISNTSDDRGNKVSVRYCGFIPNLFRLGQGAVVQGNFVKDNGAYIFMAKELLTKHDEKYHPPSTIRQ